MIPTLLSRLIILSAGILHPGYASYKAMRAKSVDEYVDWMMYWIIFAIFCGLEVGADIFVSWFPFYHELKIVLLFWLLPSQSNGSAKLYVQFVHPFLSKYEQEIDHLLAYSSYRGQDIFKRVLRRLCTISYKYLSKMVQRYWPHPPLPPNPTKVIAPITIDHVYLQRNVSPTRKIVVPLMEQAAKSKLLQLHDPNTDIVEMRNEGESGLGMQILFARDTNVDTMLPLKVRSRESSASSNESHEDTVIRRTKARINLDS